MNRILHAISLPVVVTTLVSFAVAAPPPAAEGPILKFTGVEIANTRGPSAANATDGDAAGVLVMPMDSTHGKAFSVHEAEDADAVGGCH